MLFKSNFEITATQISSINRLNKEVDSSNIVKRDEKMFNYLWAPTCNAKYLRNIRLKEQRMFMAINVELSDEIVTNAKINAKVSSRSITEQIEHWIKIGKIAEDNPDLTYDFIKNILIAQQEVAEGHFEPYKKRG